MNAEIKRRLEHIFAYTIIAVFSVFIVILGSMILIGYVKYYNAPMSLSIIVTNANMQYINVNASRLQNQLVLFPDNNWGNEYLYDIPIANNGISLIDTVPDFGFDIYTLNNNYAIIVYSNDGQISQNRINQNILNQLVYLNSNTGRADLIYECVGSKVILYGDSDIIIVYDAENNVYQYISTDNVSVKYEINAGLKTKGTDYHALVYEDKVEIMERRGKIVDVLTIYCQ